METTRSILEWWTTSFSENDREWMVGTYQPLSVSVTATPISAAVVMSDRPLTRLLAHVAYADAFHQLSNLSTWFSKAGHEHCAIAFATKAIEFYGADMPVLDRHFALANQCIALYRWRETEPGALEGAIAACEACIGIHLEAAVAAKAEFGIVPAHHCFRQLRIIEEKRGNFERAIELCEQAKAGGWADDWDKDIARLKKKMGKALPRPQLVDAAYEPPTQTLSSPVCTVSSSPPPNPPPLFRRMLEQIIRTATGGRW